MPFYPVGLPDVTKPEEPVVLGMRSPSQTVLGIWRIDGPATTKIPWTSGAAKLLYPTDLGIKIAHSQGTLEIEFPRSRMACLLTT
jgi:hypothetical protein